MQKKSFRKNPLFAFELGLLVILGLLLPACENDPDWNGNTTVSGQALDVTTEQAVAGAVVSLSVQDKNRTDQYDLLQEVATDAEGRFSFGFTTQPDKLYELKAYKGGDYEADQAVHIIGYTNTRTFNNLRLYMQPTGK